MNTSPNESNRDDEYILDDRFEDLFEKIPTPEEVREAKAWLEALSKERAAYYVKEKGDREKKG